jgi:hypothetical protein
VQGICDVSINAAGSTYTSQDGKEEIACKEVGAYHGLHYFEVFDASPITIKMIVQPRSMRCSLCWIPDTQNRKR